MALTTQNDEDLVNEARAGDEAAFAELVRACTPDAWRLARLLLGDAHEAEDAVQDAFVRAHRSLDTYRADAPFRSWLLTICRRVCLDRLRRASFDIVPIDEVPPPPAADDSTVLRVALTTAMGTLPLEEREAFVLVAVLGHTREAAAHIAGVPASTMRSRVSRARERLADALAPRSNEGS